MPQTLSEGVCTSERPALGLIRFCELVPFSQNQCINPVVKHLIITGSIWTLGIYLKHSQEICKESIIFSSFEIREIHLTKQDNNPNCKKVRNITHLMSINNEQKQYYRLAVRHRDLTSHLFACWHSENIDWLVEGVAPPFQLCSDVEWPWHLSILELPAARRVWGPHFVNSFAALLRCKSVLGDTLQLCIPLLCCCP